MEKSKSKTTEDQEKIEFAFCPLGYNPLVFVDIWGLVKIQSFFVLSQNPKTFESQNQDQDYLRFAPICSTANPTKHNLCCAAFVPLQAAGPLAGGVPAGRSVQAG